MENCCMYMSTTMFYISAGCRLLHIFLIDIYKKYFSGKLLFVGIYELHFSAEGVQKDFVRVCVKIGGCAPSYSAP